MSSDSPSVTADDLFSLPKLCNGCGRNGGAELFQCPNCSYVWYCSIECQYHDQESHNELCALLAGQPIATQRPEVALQPSQALLPIVPASMTSSPRPALRNIQAVRAFVLPVDSPRYHDTYVELTGSFGPTGGVRWAPNVSRIFGEHVSPIGAVCIRGPDDKLLRFPLHFFFEVAPEVMSSTTGHAHNICVSELTDRASHGWKGKIVVLKFNGGRRQGYQDIDEPDLKNVRHYLSQS